MSIIFNDTKSITNRLIEADTLDIDFLRPDLFVDAKTNKRLSKIDGSLDMIL